MCKVCHHPQRREIDRAIVSGDSLRKIGTTFGTSKSEVDRHKRICMKRLLPAVPAPVAVPTYQTSEEAAIAQQTTTSVLQRISGLIDMLEKQARECASDSDRRNMTATATALLKALELNARLTGEIQAGIAVGVQVNNTPPLMERTVIVLPDNKRGTRPGLQAGALPEVPEKSLSKSKTEGREMVDTLHASDSCPETRPGTHGTPIRKASTSSIVYATGPLS